MRKRRPIIFKRLGFIAALFVLLAPLALQAASLERSISITDNAIGLIGAETAGNGAKALETTAHGAERLAGAAATRGGVLAANEVAAVQQGGRLMTTNNGTTVRLMEQANGRFSVVVTNAESKIVTTMKDWSAKSIERISKNYGWTDVK